MLPSARMSISQWRAVAWHFKALNRADGDPRAVRDAATHLSRDLGVPVKARALLEWWETLSEESRHLLGALFKAQRESEQRGEVIDELRRQLRGEAPSAADAADDATATPIATIMPAMVRRKPLVVALSKAPPTVAPASPASGLPKQSQANVAAAVEFASTLLTAEEDEADATQVRDVDMPRAKASTATAENDGGVAMALRMLGKKTPRPSQPDTTTAPTQKLQPRADTVQARKDAAASSHTASLLAKLEEDSAPVRSQRGALAVGSMTGCYACGTGDGDLYKCRYCRHTFHEACGGPHPDVAPALMRCEACARALGLESSSSSEEAESEEESDTSLSGFIVSEGSSEDIDFDLMDQLAGGSTPSAVSVVSSESEVERAVRRRGRGQNKQRRTGGKKRRVR